ncbi:Alpha-L-fucosidase 1 [Senna tora]|uniref:Alpha-L-fucosidase 1 n=1 Tax=Senna tora TaxID=362788 RepID=A0A834XCF6_9FABA|nr:Alpha-L-fucosidase 1 [Senna tora]
MGWIEKGGIGAAGTPFCVCEGIHSEVQEHGHVAELPLELGSTEDG